MTTSVATGPIVGLTAANSDYTSPIYSIFTDFGTPAAGEIPASRATAASRAQMASS